MDSASHNPKATHEFRKRRNTSSKPEKSKVDIYLTKRLSYKAQKQNCLKLLSTDEPDIYIHCLGSAINHGLNLALDLVHNFKSQLTYTIHTSTLTLIDEYHPLFDSEDLDFKSRKNSAVHIKLSKFSINEINP